MDNPLRDSVDIILQQGGFAVNFAVMTRTRAWGGLSTARIARVTAAGLGRKPKSVADQPPQLAPERHRLAEVIPKGGRCSSTHGSLLGR